MVKQEKKKNNDKKEKTKEKINYNILKMKYFVLCLISIFGILILSATISIALILTFIAIFNKFLLLLKIANFDDMWVFFFTSIFSAFLIFRYPLLNTNFGLKIADKIWITYDCEIIYYRQFEIYTNINNALTKNGTENLYNKKVIKISKIIVNYIKYLNK
ncbi:hypothetical protein [Spiroplasma endosymbiont of Labia minor]|uniref:hypothetical protein n=1 Tax=Spiroplasma endosymbiont of Labia minor TaxID=3066305 RepID=UPI0030D28AD8